jgi:hypothetical protein
MSAIPDFSPMSDPAMPIDVIIPAARHIWAGDNPRWTAERLIRFLGDQA